MERVLAPLGRRVDEISPMVDARLADGSRVNVVIPPLAIDGPALSIRRFGATRPDRLTRVSPRGGRGGRPPPPPPSAPPRPDPERLVEIGTLTGEQRRLLAE